MPPLPLIEMIFYYVGTISGIYVIIDIILFHHILPELKDDLKEWKKKRATKFIKSKVN